MGEENSKIARIIRDELRSTKVMILAIMFSFGLVLAIVNFMINTMGTLEMLTELKWMMQSPYDRELNNTISSVINVTGIMHIVAFFVEFIPMLLLALGVYLIYLNAKEDYSIVKTTGLKIASNAMKCYSIISFVYAGLFVVAGLVVLIAGLLGAEGFAGMLGDTSEEMIMAVIIIAIVIVAVLMVAAVILVAKGIIFLFINGNIKYMRNVFQNKFAKKLSVIGAVAFVMVGVDNIITMFMSIGDFSSMSLSSDDMALLEEAYGGTMAHMIEDLMPSATVQFESAAVSMAYSFFIGVAQLLAGITLASMVSKINKLKRGQVVRRYGEEDFTGGNQC